MPANIFKLRSVKQGKKFNRVGILKPLTISKG